MKCKNCGHEIVWDGLVHCRVLDCNCLNPEPVSILDESKVVIYPRNENITIEDRKFAREVLGYEEEPDSKESKGK